MAEYSSPVQYCGENEKGIFEVLVKCINRDNGELQKVPLQVPNVIHHADYTCTAYTGIKEEKE